MATLHSSLTSVDVLQRLQNEFGRLGALESFALLGLQPLSLPSVERLLAAPKLSPRLEIIEASVDEAPDLLVAGRRRAYVCRK